MVNFDSLFLFLHRNHVFVRILVSLEPVLRRYKLLLEPVAWIASLAIFVREGMGGGGLFRLTLPPPKVAACKRHESPVITRTKICAEGVSCQSK